MKPMVLPAATETVSVAAPGLTLHVTSLEVTDVTGELLTGWRTAAVEVVSPAMRVDQISVERWMSIEKVECPNNYLQCAEALWATRAREARETASFIFSVGYSRSRM